MRNDLKKKINSIISESTDLKEFSDSLEGGYPAGWPGAA